MPRKQSDGKVTGSVRSSRPRAKSQEISKKSKASLSGSTAPPPNPPDYTENGEKTEAEKANDAEVGLGATLFDENVEEAMPGEDGLPYGVATIFDEEAGEDFCMAGETGLPHGVATLLDEEAEEAMEQDRALQQLK